MSNFAQFIVALLIAFPVLYVCGIIVFLSIMAKKSNKRFLEIVKHLIGLVKASSIIKTLGLSTVSAAGVYAVFVSSMDATLVVKVFVLLDITLLLLTALWSISDNLLFDKTEWNGFQNTRINMFTHNANSSSGGAKNSRFDSDDEFSDTDMNTDPAYAFWHGNIYHDMHKDNHIQDWNNEIADN